jgi:hypothetical protein
VATKQTLIMAALAALLYSVLAAVPSCLDVAGFVIYKNNNCQNALPCEHGAYGGIGCEVLHSIYSNCSRDPFEYQY